MTDRALPYACGVANRVVDVLADKGDVSLAGEVAAVTRATCDLVHALHREHEATTPAEQTSARHDRMHAEARLRSGPQDTDDTNTHAVWAQLRNLLRARKRKPGARRHAGFLNRDEPV